MSVHILDSELVEGPRPVNRDFSLRPPMSGRSKPKETKRNVPHTPRGGGQRLLARFNQRGGAGGGVKYSERERERGAQRGGNTDFQN